MFGKHSHRALVVLPVLILATAFTVAAPRALAQSPQPGIALQDLGSKSVTSTDWSFSGDFDISAGAWESVTISNYGYCFVGPNDPRAGTAHAGGVFYFAELAAQPPGSDGYSFTGDITPGRGGNVSGQVTVTTSISTGTHVDVTLSGSDLSFYKDNKLQVCLLGSS
jgi:hypothetical protein